MVKFKNTCARASCGLPPLKGGKLCRFHGGNSPTHLAAAKRRILAEKMVTYGLPVEDGRPEDLLLQEIRRTAGHVQWLGDKIAQLQEEQLVYGTTRVEQQIGGEAGGYNRITMEAAPTIWLNLYMKERAHLAKCCHMAISSGIEERRVKAAEQLADAIGTAITGMLSRLGLDVTDPHVREIAHATILEVASG